MKIEFEPDAVRRLRPSDAGTTLVFAGDGGPVQLELPADVPGGAVIHVLQWTPTGNITLTAIEGSTLTGPSRTSGRGVLVRLLAVSSGDWLATTG
jgi:hypothetical protein